MQHVGPQASALQTAIIRAADLLRHVLRLARRLEQLAVLLRRHVPLRLHLQVPRLLEARALAGHALQQRLDALRHHRALQLEVEHQQRVQLVARQRRVVRRQVALELLRRAARLRQLRLAFSSDHLSPLRLPQRVLELAQQLRHANHLRAVDHPQKPAQHLSAPCLILRCIV